MFFCFFKQKTAYEMRISDWSSDVCSSDLDIGRVESAEQRGDLHLRIASGYDMDSVAIGASIACSGVCLTVVEKGPDWFAVDVSGERLSRTAPDMWAQGARLNLERALRVGEALGGHIVPCPVDGVGRLILPTQEGRSP